MSEAAPHLVHALVYSVIATFLITRHHALVERASPGVVALSGCPDVNLVACQLFSSPRMPPPMPIDPRIPAENSTSDTLTDVYDKYPPKGFSMHKAFLRPSALAAIIGLVLGLAS